MANPITFLCALIIMSYFGGISSTMITSTKTDRHSLLAFKDALDNDPLGSLTSWNETTELCSWKGIRCSRKHPDRVVMINLTSQRLVGPLSPHIGNMSFLRFIILDNNSFHGQIPQEIGLLRRLEYIEFSDNFFSGSIPTNISQCKSLYYLNLLNNDLSGTIIPELQHLYKLRALGLGQNKFLGPIPSFIGNFTSLQILSFFYGFMQGEIPESITKLHRLEFLALNSNNLTGAIPIGIFNLSRLITLQLSSNLLAGTIPSTMFITLPNLKDFTVGGNYFTGALPVSLENATLINTVGFPSNNFIGPMPRVGKLSQIRLFSVAQNLIANDISFISEFNNSTNLKILDLGGNNFFGSLPNSMVNLSIHLEHFTLYAGQIHGSIPFSIGNLIGLNHFDLGDNNLKGPIPASIGRLFRLQELYLESNGFGDDLPSLFGNLSLLNRLYLERNKFGGTIPTNLGNCTNLLELDLSHNHFTGPLPKEVLSLSSITISLILSYNNFTGSIPSEVRSLTNLASLDFSNNRLEGTIPSFISSCRSLQYVHLEGNLIEGSIPFELDAIKSLQYLDLSRNNMSGSIPPFLGKLHLLSLNLSFNKFKGEVPQFWHGTKLSLEGNNELCGGVLELKLPPCPVSNAARKSSSLVLKISIPIGVVALLFFMSIFLYMRKTPKKHVLSSPLLDGPQILRLSYMDLLKATDGFSSTCLVGNGRYGYVYKGTLGDGQPLVAVKVLNLLVKGSTKSCIAECNALRGIRHRNLVKLLSVCESIDLQGNDFQALVYEFKSHGSLDKALYHGVKFDNGSEAELTTLSIIQRLNIAIDIAHAVEYLHCGTSSTIVHGDLKPSNILLDHDLTAFVGDFGLSKIIPHMISTHESTTSTVIKGTVGYIAPEYATSHLISTQGDVYSYGILLLEMFTCKRPTDDLFKDSLNLHNLVDASLPDHLPEIVDPLIDLNDNQVKTCLESVFNIGVSCSKEMPKERISMSNVVKNLHKIKEEYLSYNAHRRRRT